MWLGDLKISADLAGENIVNLSVSGHGGDLLFRADSPRWYACYLPAVGGIRFLPDAESTHGAS